MKSPIHKKSTVRTALSLLFACGGLLQPAAAESVLLNKVRAGDNVKVVLLGTSLTAAGTWPASLQSWLSAESPGPGTVTVVNGAKSGEASDHGVAVQTPAALTDNPDAVFIEFSMNDAATTKNITKQQSEDNLNWMIDQFVAQNPNVIIILQTMNCLPADTSPFSPRDDLNGYNQIYRDVAVTRSLTIIDHYPNWLDIFTNDLTTWNSYMTDAVHPNELGQNTVLMPYLKEVLGPPSMPPTPTGDVIVSENFGGLASANLTGTSADTFASGITSSTTAGSAAWVASSDYKADGGVTTRRTSAYLNLGSYIEEAKGTANGKFILQAKVGLPTSTIATWFSLGFAAQNTPATTKAFNDQGISGATGTTTGYATMLYRTSGDVDQFAGPGSAIPIAEDNVLSPGTRTLSITLDFTPAGGYNGSSNFGTVTFGADTGTDNAYQQYGSHTYTSAAPIGSILLSGFGDISNTSGTISTIYSNVTLSQVFEVPPPPVDTRPTWVQFRDANFGTDVVASANPYADHDGNGIINLFEHAFGEDAITPEKFNQPLVDFSTAPDSITLFYPKAAKDIDYFAEWSPDLSPGSWSRAGFAAETQDPVSEWFSRSIQFDPAPPRSFLRLGVGIQDPAVYPKGDGFRGLWYELSSQMFEYGRKYSGGLGTYTANHVPMAIHAPEVNRTYFTWGGTTAPNEKNLLIMVSYLDHNTGLVTRPVIVMDKTPVDDAHDNGSMSIDEEGYIWIFVSGRGTIRLGRIYRSKVPYGINDWINMGDSEFTYPQPWWFKGKGFLHTYTRYTPGRELYYRTSRNGTGWSTEKKLAGLEGHYQTSEQVGDRVITAFNRHPGRNVDRRTDLYYMETADMGETWTTADGTVLTTPITTVSSPARIRNYSSNADPADNALVYIHDTTADADGRPVILYLTAKSYEPGPDSGPRTWMVARWTGTEWLFHPITTSTHNYDTGSIYIEEDGTWKVIGPIGAGPQFWGTGGEIELWTSADQGATWAKQRAVTSNSPRNHSYARRPRNAHPDFYCYWADGSADTFSESHLYFTNKAGDKVWRLPYDMTEDFAAPVLHSP